MRLIDFLIERKTFIPTSSAKISSELPTDKFTPLGSGIQAITYLNNKDPNKVIKLIDVKGVDDPVYQFLSLCKRTNNSFLPKIYHLKLFKSEDLNDEQWKSISSHFDTKFKKVPPNLQEYKLLAVSERLYSPMMLESDIILDEFLKIHLLPSDDKAKMFYKNSTPSMLLDMVSRRLRNPSYRQEVIASTPSSELKSALRLLNPLFNRYHFDLHPGNWMVRLNQDSPEFVINDPIA